MAINVTIAYNSVGTSGSAGGVYSNGQATFYNTIVDSNTTSSNVKDVGRLEFDRWLQQPHQCRQPGPRPSGEQRRSNVDGRPLDRQSRHR